MHLCANVVLQRLLPERAIVRRNFTFQAGEKNILNRFYRRVVDGILARRHVLVDHFFQLEPLEPSGRLQKVFSLSRRFVVEIEAHPAKADEYHILTSGEILRWVDDIPISDGFMLQPGAEVTSEGGDSGSSPHVTYFSGIP
jgi:hypothetical protein